MVLTDKSCARHHAEADVPMESHVRFGWEVVSVPDHGRCCYAVWYFITGGCYNTRKERASGARKGNPFLCRRCSVSWDYWAL